MSETVFVRLHEDNDHEGESWNFWLQHTGNEAEMLKLGRMLDEAEAEADEVGYDFAYALTTDFEPESVVDKLVEYAEGGYMASHNKVVGAFVCPDDLDDYAEDLYKGGIKRHFARSTE